MCSGRVQSLNALRIHSDTMILLKIENLEMFHPSQEVTNLTSQAQYPSSKNIYPPQPHVPYSPPHSHTSTSMTQSEVPRSHDSKTDPCKRSCHRRLWDGRSGRRAGSIGLGGLWFLDGVLRRWRKGIHGRWGRWWWRGLCWGCSGLRGRSRPFRGGVLGWDTWLGGGLEAVSDVIGGCIAAMCCVVL